MRQPTNHYLNNLWIARKRSGLGQKAVARLLGHRTVSTISEYETGRMLPNLRTALKLAAIYGTAVCDLYAELFHEAANQVADARRRNPAVRPRLEHNQPHALPL